MGSVWPAGATATTSPAASLWGGRISQPSGAAMV